MAEINRAVDALGLFLTGGVTNTNPDLSLGGARSSTRIRGLGAILSSAIPSLRIDNVFPACGEGDATLSVDANGKLVFTPPGAAAGTPVAIAAGESKVVTGADANKAVRVFREAGLPFTGTMGLHLVNALNGVLAHGNVTHAQRLAGVTTYRALMLFAQNPQGIIELKLWLPHVAGAQAAFAIATETPVSDTIQTIPNELTAPAGMAWVTLSRKEEDAMVIPAIDAGQSLGLWIRRIFPVGYVTPQENFQLAMKFRGA